MTEPVYRRVVVKVSGEALMGPDAFGIHQPTLEGIAADLVATQALGVSVAVVAGGGNIFRGVKVSEQGIPRVTGDMMGILATVMNALALESAIEKAGIAARTMSALAMPEVCETYERRQAVRHLEAGRLVLLGNPVSHSLSPVFQNAALKKGASSSVRMKVSEKGAVSIYGMGRFPVTLYKEQWLKLLAMSDEIRAFIAANEAQLKAKD